MLVDTSFPGLKPIRSLSGIVSGSVLATVQPRTVRAEYIQAEEKKFGVL